MRSRRRRLTNSAIRISSSTAAGRADLVAVMRLLTVTLFFVILHHIRAAEIKSLPVDSRTDSTPINNDFIKGMKRSCVDAVFKLVGGGNITVDGNNCKIGLNNRYIVASADNTEIKGLGYCQNKIIKCVHDGQSNSRICKQDATRGATTLAKGDAVFADSDLCAIQMVNNRLSVEIRSRYKQTVFTSHQGDGSFVQTAANYLQDLPNQVEVARDNDRLVLGDTFDYGNAKSADCGHICGYGAHMEFQNVAVNQRFIIDLYPKSTCSWIAICFKHSLNKGCNEKYRLVLLLDHDIVLPQSYNSAIKMKLRDARHIRLERPDSDALEKYMYIIADTHDRIVLDAVNSEKRMALMTSDHECFIAPMRSSLGVVSVAQVNKGKNPNTNGNVDPNKVGNSGEMDNKHIVSRGAATTVMDEFQDPTTVSPMVFTQTAGASTTELTYKPPEINSIEMAKTNNENSNTDASQEGWLTWAYFYGALTGSTLGFVICGVLFFLCRRSIYGDWYRGMYKRYGCDASGTTGGVTGAEFGATTTGGNTTIGATTAGATATSATTGGDTTSNSAMSGTSGASGTGQSTMITM